MMFDKEKLLSVFDQTVQAGTDPVRTHAGRLSVASEPPQPDAALTATAVGEATVSRSLARRLRAHAECGDGHHLDRSWTAL